MSIERVIVSDDNMILYALMPGKPDPKAEKPQGKDTRPRVFQKGNHDHVCTYFAANMIRDRVHSTSSGFEKQRVIEKQCSAWRKEISASSQFQNNPVAYFQSMEGANKKVLELFGKKDSNALVLSFWKKMTCDALKQDPIIIRHGKCAEVEQMLEVEFPKIQQQSKLVKSYVESQLLHGYTSMEVVTQLGLKRSSWVPGKGISGLIKALKDHGPMCIMGNFGPFFYKEDPTLPQEINGYTILGWKPGSTRQLSSTFLSHTVVLVGAKAKPPRVYFVDPNHSSAPGEQRPIYINSDKVFFENLRSLAGLPMAEGMHSETIGYTLFNPHIKDYL